MTMTKLRDLDQLMGRAVNLLYRVTPNAHDPVMHPEEWEGERLTLINEYRDLVLSFDDTPSPAAALGVPMPDDPRFVEARGTGGVAVRWIVGEVLGANPEAHRAYHEDPQMRAGMEVVIGVLGAVATVLVDEGDTAEFASHLVHVVAHRLSAAVPPPGVRAAVIAEGNLAADALREQL